MNHISEEFHGEVTALALRSAVRAQRGARAHLLPKGGAGLLVGLLLGLVFMAVGTDIAGVRNRMGALFLAHAFLALGGPAFGCQCLSWTDFS